MEASEGRGQGGPVYEDVLPKTKEADTVFEMEGNMAYGTNTANL